MAQLDSMFNFFFLHKSSVSELWIVLDKLPIGNLTEAVTNNYLLSLAAELAGNLPLHLIVEKWPLPAPKTNMVEVSQLTLRFKNSESKSQLLT